MVEPPRTRVDIITDRLSTLSQDVAVMAERQRQLLAEQKEHLECIKELSERLAVIEKSAMKTAGGFAVIMALGAAGGWLIASWQSLANLFRVK